MKFSEKDIFEKEVHSERTKEKHQKCVGITGEVNPEKDIYQRQYEDSGYFRSMGLRRHSAQSLMFLPHSSKYTVPIKRHVELGVKGVPTG